MLAGPHLAVGALTGRVVRQTWLALPLAFASHWALDALPHSYLSLREPGHLSLKLVIVAMDLVVGVALVLWLAQGQPHRRLILAAALTAVTVDLLNPANPFGQWLAGTSAAGWLVSTHLGWSWHVPFGSNWPLEFGPSVAVLMLISLAAWRGGATRRTSRLHRASGQRPAAATESDGARPQLAD